MIIPAHFRRFLPRTRLLLLPLLLLAACRPAPPPRAAWVEAASHKNLGLAYLERNDFERAATEFEAVRRLIPDDPLGYADLALSYLHRGKAEQAEKFVRQALALRKNDAALRAILADVYAAQGKQAQAVETLAQALESDPAAIDVRYKYLKMSQRLQGPGRGTGMILTQLRRIVEQAPGNVAARAELGEALARAGRFEAAAGTYRALEGLLAALPEETRSYLDATLASLEAGRAAVALRNAAIFGNLLKRNPTYQTTRDALGDPSQPHPPLYAFRTAPPDMVQTGADTLVAMRFRPAGVEMFGTETAKALRDMETDDIALVDYDEDGRLDLALVARGRVRLFHHGGGGWTEVTRAAGLGKITRAQLALFGDMDNDGDQDLFVMRRGRDALFRYEKDGTFSPVRKTPFAGRDAGGKPYARFVDMDHDGDLDLLTAEGVSLRWYRNVDNGLFEEATGAAGLTPLDAASGLVYGDFDQDGAIDLFIANGRGPHRLYRNLRRGRMGDRTARFGVQGVLPASVVVAGDFNNDGSPDLFLTGSETVPCTLLWNEAGRTFDRGNTPVSLVRICGGLAAASAVAFDFDNDGFLDLAVVGTAGDGGPGLRLIRNLGNGRFEDATSLLPPLPAIRDVEAGDVDGDGDTDLMLVTAAGVTALRNDGGNKNGWLDVQLAAVLTGGGKNNFYGIGSTIELNAGTHYQRRLVTSAVTHFGLGAHDHADVMRVFWSNGIPQNKVHPERNTRIVERQRLKGSCPSLYTWNGTRYVFVTHLMTRSAIGALTETGAPAFPDAAADYVKIRGDQLRERDGVYTLNVVEELWDAVYLDKMRLLVIDHPAASEVFVDETFTPPPFRPFRIYTATPRRPLRAATDQRGRDVLPLLAARDSLYVGDFPLSAYQGLAGLHAVTLDLGDIRDAKEIRLFLNGWIMPVEPSSNLALSQRGGRHAIAPCLEVPDARGRWTKVMPYIGFPSGEHKTMVVDLSDKFLTDDYRVRITTNLAIYWDEAFYTVDEPDVPVKITRLTPRRADLHYRGFSREYRAARYGPYLRDYGTVRAAQQWLPFTGYRTRYGAVRPLLQEADDRYVVFSSGEEVRVTFAASRLPSLPAGWTRDYALYSDGWLKEGDLNTDTAATIEPLPVHGMRRYPYAPNEQPPDTAARRAYLETYQTRWASQAPFRRAIRRIGDAAGVMEASAEAERR